MVEFEKRLQTLTKEALQELNAIGIFPSKSITSIKVNSRAKKRLGCCRRETVKGREIFKLEISYMLREHDDRTVKGVIIHELLHTCPGCQNHGMKWKAMVKKVNEKYGYNIQTTAKYEDLNIRVQDVREHRYEICCLSCGNKGYRQKRSMVIQHPENYKCGKCGGKLKVTDLQI